MSFARRIPSQAVNSILGNNNENANTAVPLAGKNAVMMETRRTALGDVSNKGLAGASKKRMATKVVAKPITTRTRGVVTRSQKTISTSRVPGNVNEQQTKRVKVTHDQFQTSESHAMDCSEDDDKSKEGHYSRMLETSMDSLELKAMEEDIEDIDSGDVENPQLASIYVNEIYTYLWEQENKWKIDHSYMTRQADINVKMRTILIDWLIEVHNKFKLLQETLYLTVHVIDRFLQLAPVDRSKLQLVGVAGMMIASKYEETYEPEVRDFVFITDNAYTREQIVAMESIMLEKLDYSLGVPLPLHFLRRNSKAAHADVKIHTLAKYLMELTLQEYAMLEYLPSEIAAGALNLSMKLLGHADCWSPTLKYYSSYSEASITNVTANLVRLARAAPTNKLTAVRDKYDTAKFQHIASSSFLSPTRLATLL